MSHLTVSRMGVVALAAATTFAQSNTTASGQASGSGTSGQSSTSGRSGSLAAADKKFVMEAAQGGLAEVELGRLASRKASKADVKSFAQTMVDDHSKANDELKTLASGKGITVPSDLDARHKATMSRLETLSGAPFDRAYVQEMVRDHEKDVAEFKREAGSARDQELKDWAGKTLPTLEQHLQHARRMASMGQQ